MGGNEMKNVFLLVGVHSVAWQVLVSHPGIEPVPPAEEARSLNGWTTREVQDGTIFWLILFIVVNILKIIILTMSKWTVLVHS